MNLVTLKISLIDDNKPNQKKCGAFRSHGVTPTSSIRKEGIFRYKASILGVYSHFWKPYGNQMPSGAEVTNWVCMGQVIGYPNH